MDSNGIYILVLSIALSQYQFVATQQILRPSEYLTQKPSSRPESLGPRPQSFTAKPGNVIVHFDSSHDIQRLQYVLQDGRLATLYQRRNYPPAINSRVPIQVPAGEAPHLYRREELANGAKYSSAETPLRIDHEQTINILDDKLRKVSQLVGDHITIELPNHQIFEGQIVPTEAQKQQQPHSDVDNELDVLATVAVDSLQVGESKFKKAGIILEKLKSKVSEKLRDLPSIIETKLRDKSSSGQVYMDEAGRRVMVLADEHETPASTDQNRRQQYQHQQRQQLYQQFTRPAKSQPIFSKPELSKQQLTE